MIDVYNRHKSPDGFLYLAYSLKEPLSGASLSSLKKAQSRTPESGASTSEVKRRTYSLTIDDFSPVAEHNLCAAAATRIEDIETSHGPGIVNKLAEKSHEVLEKSKEIEALTTQLQELQAEMERMQVAHRQELVQCAAEAQKDALEK